MRTGFLRTPMISSEREPMSDITITDKEVKVAVEMPGCSERKYQNKCLQWDSGSNQDRSQEKISRSY